MMAYSSPKASLSDIALSRAKTSALLPVKQTSPTKSASLQSSTNRSYSSSVPVIILPFTVYSRAKTFRDSFNLTFLDTYMHIENPSGTKNWSYNAFKYFIETPNFFHLYIDEQSFFLIPKEAFSDSDQIHAARLLFRDQIPKKN